MRSYYEEVTHISNLAAILPEKYPLAIKTGGMLMPTFLVLRKYISEHFLEDEKIIYLSRNPGIKKIAKTILKKDARYIFFQWKGKDYAVTPRSIFLYLLNNGPQIFFSLLEYLSHHKYRCFQYNTGLLSIARHMLAMGTNFAPVCRRGKIVAVVSSIDIVNALRKSPRAGDFKVYDLKNLALNPVKVSTVEDIITQISKWAHATLSLKNSVEHFIDEVVLHEASKTHLWKLL